MNAIYPVCMAASLFIAAQGAVAQNLTITVHAQKQGTFKGEIALKDPRSKAEARSELLDVHYEIDNPRDAATGQVRRIHKPLTVVKRFGPSSPQYLTALSTNETLSQVLIEGFNANRTTGEMLVAFTIKLTNASVTHVESRVVPAANIAGKGGVASPDDLQEVIQFTYQGIEVTSPIGKTMFADSWSSR